MGRAALVLVGCVAALALLEVVLRAAGMIYHLRQEAVNQVSLERDSTYRILCLGESTTAGLAWGEKAYPQQMEGILNERAAGEAVFSVINGGEVATTSDVILAKLPDRLDELQPQIVVTMMGINDGPLIDPGFQVGGRLRVWKLAKMLYHTWRREDERETPERMMLRATAVLRNWPAVAADLAERASQLAPGDPQPLLILAEAKARLGESQSAQQLYAQTFALEPAAVIAHAYEILGRFSGPLEQAMSRFPNDANALAARAILALSKKRPAVSLALARQATEADPENVFALAIEGSALLASQSVEEARDRYERALEADPALASLLAARPPTRSPLFSQLARASEVPAETDAGKNGRLRWFTRPAEKRADGFDGLKLMGAWQNTAKGEVERATEALQELLATADPQKPRLRLNAYGQLAILEWQAGNRDRAEQYHQKIEDFLEIVDNPVTRKNYRALLALLRERGIQLVAVQYPMRRVEPLKRLLEWPSDVVFVDNEQLFKNALLGRPAAEIFADLFAGDFGHLTPLGNRILAENVADAILGIVDARKTGQG